MEQQLINDFASVRTSLASAASTLQTRWTAFGDADRALLTGSLDDVEALTTAYASSRTQLRTALAALASQRQSRRQILENLEALYSSP